MTNEIRTKVLVVGSGPGGYVAAIRAGQLGLDTTIVETGRLGGTCLIRGCIPSKALIHVAGKFEAMQQAANGGSLGIRLREAPILDLPKTIAWKETIVDKLNSGVAALLKRVKVKTVQGWASFSNAKTCIVSGSGDPVTIIAEHVILANGSEPVELPALPFGDVVLSSTEALSLQEIPEQFVVVGAGYIGLELGIAFRKMGSNVTIVEALDRILPLYDEQLTDPVGKWLARSGVTVHLGAKATGLTGEANRRSLQLELKDGQKLEIPADKILVTVGRRPKTRGWGLESMAVDMKGPFVKVDDQCKTSVKNVWAIGDLVGEPMLAHKASAQAEMVAEIIAGKVRRFTPATIPAVCFTEPEIVTAGMLPAEAKMAGNEAISGLFPLSANGRALSMEGGSEGGFVRIVARRDNHRVLGVQAVGTHVSELSGEFAQAIEMGA
ncbi:MAG: dihydrolipoyl dehydrogenase, partial [Bradyrhizobium sp.]|nr:dihydrolipoyl dehydrogenase [Bradyrhizobium sp.]